MKQRLMELLNDYCIYADLGSWEKEALADYLLNNGVLLLDVEVVSVYNRPLITHCFDKPLDEIISLIRAKDEGRIIVPPVKIGQTVYRLRHTLSRPIHKGFVSQINIYAGDRKARFYDDELPFSFTVEDLGVEVFFTHEDAEKALAERSENET